MLADMHDRRQYADEQVGAGAGKAETAADEEEGAAAIADRDTILRMPASSAPAKPTRPSSS